MGRRPHLSTDYSIYVCFPVEILHLRHEAACFPDELLRERSLIIGAIFKSVRWVNDCLAQLWQFTSRIVLLHIPNS